MPGRTKSGRSYKSPGRDGPATLAAWKKLLLAATVLLLVVAAGFFVYYYVRFSRLIDARLSGEVFDNASLVLAAPTRIRLGQPASATAIAVRLRRALYAEGGSGSRVGTYRLVGDRLEIRPGPASFFKGEDAAQGPVVVEFHAGSISSITALDGSGPLETCLLEPEVMTTLFDSSRAKRRLIRYQDMPQVLVDALVATEDHRFFSHRGVNIYRALAAAIADLRAGAPVQGFSTLTMQLARNFFLTPQRTIRRKAAEVFLALLLEQRLTKAEILELYANQVYLGQRGSFSIYGFGEAADAYFNKNVRGLTLGEAALLVGLIRGPNLYSPYKYPARARERRNLVLRRMLETGFITASGAAAASAAPLNVIPQNVEGTQAPFFVDMVKDELLTQFPERDLVSQSYRVYTTVDLDLQRAASEGIRIGLQEVDELVKQRSRRARDGAAIDPNQPQVALLALDPHTGEVKALVGGRNYGVSQLNHALARRQPGSSFKPFVYAAALSSAVDGMQPVITPATVLVDEPTTFRYGEETYEPENYKREYHGLVTVREALTHSLNVATVRLAEIVGYERVRKLAVEAGLGRELLPTPALALGAYVATPLEIAAAYAILANGGEYVGPRFILAVKDAAGNTLFRSPVVRRPVLDPRVCYLMVSLLEEVIGRGTGAGVRNRGFWLPAAGKTGTSHDGWFAGFTSDLLAVVWVGYDDDRELGLPGASSALPIWTEFMKRAVTLPSYSNAQPFVAPPGIVVARIDPRTHLVATGESPSAREEVFIEGSEPRGPDLRQGTPGILSRMFQSEAVSAVPAAAAGGSAPLDVEQKPAKDAPGPSEKKQSGLVKKFVLVFKGGDSKAETPAQPQHKSDP